MSEYRAAPFKCPTCGESMEERVLSGSTVDTCPRCRGLWVDWFDGELIKIVKETAPLSTRQTFEVDAARAVCPRCAQHLTNELFDGSILLYRCGDCVGCFVPRDSFTLLMELDHKHTDAAKRGAFDRLLGVIRKLFYVEPTVKLGD
jgi:Zn-finger nucleic acid-binding protein